MRTILAALTAFVVMTSSAFGQDLPGIKADLKFDAALLVIDLENPALEFHYKSGKHQGSSIGFHVAEPGHRKSGTFAPSNTSNNLEAEVVSYRLARFLGISDIYNPVGYYRLGPKATARFKAMLAKRHESDHDRQVNYANVLAEIKSHPTWLQGIYRHRQRGSRFVVVGLATEAGHLNSGHPLATFIRANGPIPGDKAMSLASVRGQRAEFPKPSEKESELARQLSNILLVDQLMGQWDRFFNNLEAFGDASGRLQLLARDNGGATVNDWEWHNRYDRWLSRYDRNVMDRLKELLAFLHGREKLFSGFNDVEKFKTALGFIEASSFSTFKRKLELLVEKKLPDLEKRYGARTYFAAPAVDGARAATHPTALPKSY